MAKAFPEDSRLNKNFAPIRMECDAFDLEAGTGSDAHTLLAFQIGWTVRVNVPEISPPMVPLLKSSPSTGSNPFT